MGIVYRFSRLAKRLQPRRDWVIFALRASDFRRMPINENGGAKRNQCLAFAVVKRAIPQEFHRHIRPKEKRACV